MDEETKVKLRQITEMISIYQSSISDDIDMENMKLIQIDLQNKEQQLNEIKEILDDELSKLYENGANEIDPEVNQLQRQIQEIDNSLENISDIVSMRAPIHQMEPLENKEKIEEIQHIVHEENQEIDNAKDIQEENILDNREEEKLEEQIVPESEINADVIEEDEVSENNLEIDTVDEEENEIVDTLDQTPIVDEIVEEFEEEIEPIKQEEIEICDVVSQEPVVEAVVEEFEEESIDLKNQNEVSNMMIQLRDATSNYKQESETVVDNRDKTVKTPGQAIERGNRASELVMANIQKTLVGDKKEKSELVLEQEDRLAEKITENYREDDEKIR